jgi:hypothetical protein
MLRLSVLSQVAFFILMNAHRIMVDFTLAMFDLEQEIGVRPTMNVKIPMLMSAGQKGKLKEEKAGTSFFSSLTPLVNGARIETSWAKMKAVFLTSKSMHRVSVVPMLKDYDYFLMSLLIEQHFITSYRPCLLMMAGGAHMRQQITDILLAYWELDEETSETTFQFWDGLKGNLNPSKDGLMMMAEQNCISSVKAIQQGSKEFNQHIITIVEKGKPAHENFDVKSPLGRHVQQVIDNLIWVGHSSDCGCEWV